MSENTYVKTVRVTDLQAAADAQFGQSLRHPVRQLLVEHAENAGATKPYIFRVIPLWFSQQTEVMILADAGAVRRGLAVRRSRKAGRWFE